MTYGKTFVSKFLYKRQRLPCNPSRLNQTGSILFPFDATTSSIMIEAECFFVDTLGCLETFLQCCDPINLFVEDRINDEGFLIDKNEDAISVILQTIHERVLLSRRFWNIAALNRSVLERLRFFHSFFDRPGHKGDRNFLLLCQFHQFLTWVVFEDIPMASRLITWGLPDRGRFFRDSETRPSNVVPPDEESFCLPSAALKSQFSWSSRVTKWIFQFFNSH